MPIPPSHRLRLPAAASDEPGLILAADVADVSRVVFLYNPAEIDPRMAWADLDPIEQAVFLTDIPIPLEGAEGWDTFGMLLQPGRGLPPGSTGMQLQYGMPRWLLALQWQPTRSAWDALLAAQDQHMPARLSLIPWLIVPLMFCARMQAFPLGRVVGGNTAARWLPQCAVAQRKLQSTLIGLYTLWIHGPTERARLYRSNAPAPLAGLTAAQERVIAELGQFVGAAPLDLIRTAHHPEPGIIRLLDQASTQLWDREQVDRMPSGDLLAGLLPIAGWQAEPPTPLHGIIPRSNSELLRWWRDWLKKGTRPAH